MRAKLLKTGNIFFVTAQNIETRSGFMMLTENFGFWFDIDEFEFVN